MLPARPLLALLLLPSGGLLSQSARPDSLRPHSSAITAPAIRAAVEPVVHELCGKSVALLGESPLHAFGSALEFKVQVVRRLVTDCHFNAFFIESGIYDFLNIQSRLAARQDVSEAMVSAAIGGIWAYHEMDPLLPFLLEHARSGQLVLGGLDDQLGRGSYATREMPADLVQYLGDSSRSPCLSVLQRHMQWQYTADAPYDAKANGTIVGCLRRIDSAVSRSRSARAGYDEMMTRTLIHALARDFDPSAAAAADQNVQRFNERDRTMYQNFEWLASRLPAGSKIIVWAATNHVAKDLSGVPGQTALVSLGSYIHHEFGARAYALGFSAYAGAYAFGRQAPRQLAVAPDSSLEARALAGRPDGVTFLDYAALKSFGTVAARPTSLEFKRASWSEVLDGLVVFREERPPTP